MSFIRRNLMVLMQFQHIDFVYHFNILINKPFLVYIMWMYLVILKGIINNFELALCVTIIQCITLSILNIKLTNKFARRPAPNQPHNDYNYNCHIWSIEVYIEPRYRKLLLSFMHGWVLYKLIPLKLKMKIELLKNQTTKKP